MSVGKASRHKRMRVLHVIGAMDRGGIENGLMHLYRGMDRDKLQFDFAVHSSHEGVFEREIAALGGRVYRLPDPRQRPLAFYLSLKHVLQEWIALAESESEVPAAVHSHVFRFSGVVLRRASQAGIPIRVAHSHRVASQEQGIRALYASIMGRMLRRYATYRIGASEVAARSLFGSNWSRDGLAGAVLPNAIDVEAYKLAPSERTKLREQWFGEDSEQGPVVLHVGRFIPEKNHRFILDVFERLRVHSPRAMLVLAGTGPMMDEVRNDVDARGLMEAVRFLGLSDRVPELMASADVFLFPSKTEGLGMAAVEAQAAGLMCLASEAIPPEADLGVGSMVRLSLSEPPDRWATRLLELSRQARPDEQLISIALQEKKFAATALFSTLKGIYTHGSA